MKCPTCSQDVPHDVNGLVQARVATRIDAERAARGAHVRAHEAEAWMQAKCTIEDCWKSKYEAIARRKG